MKERQRSVGSAGQLIKWVTVGIAFERDLWEFLSRAALCHSLGFLLGFSPG